MTDFTVPPSGLDGPELAAAREALVPDAVAPNVVPIKTSPRALARRLDTEPHNAETLRRLSVEAAAVFVETLRWRIETAPPERVTPECVASLLTELAKAIRDLKDLPLGPGNGGAA
ncbi:MAG TPA: hypothetical protein VG758_21170 [Hyphomicrobiaceae bacterium]|jgi:hypothetical protein|nr:hypothetical protein [Hyphomicrobiaceae bacterium]